MNILYFGYNSFNEFKRGVENVILFQSETYPFQKKYYLHWGSKTFPYKYNNFICISIKHCYYWPIILNLLVFKIFYKNNKKLIIHSHNPLFTFFSILKTKILTVHDGLFYLAKLSNNKLSSLLYIVELVSYYRTQNVHFISKFTKNNSLYKNSKNYVIIYNSTTLEKFKKNDITPILENNNILVVKSIEKKARFDLIIDLAKQLSNFTFTIAGKGPLLDYFQKEVILFKINNIKFLGFVSDENLVELYNDTFLVINLAEYGEGFGLPIIESYMFDRPVLASNKCAIPEVIIDKSFLISNNTDNILEKITYVKDVYKNFNYNEFYLKNFSNKVISINYFNYYSSFI